MDRKELIEEPKTNVESTVHEDDSRRTKKPYVVGSGEDHVVVVVLIFKDEGLSGGFTCIDSGKAISWRVVPQFWDASEIDFADDLPRSVERHSSNKDMTAATVGWSSNIAVT